MFGILALLAFPLAFGSAVGSAFAGRKILLRRLHNDELSQQPDGDTKSAAAVPRSRRLMVMALTGAIAYLLAVSMFTLSFWLFGVYPPLKPIEQLESVVNPVPGSLAEQAGIRAGDRIVSIGSDPINHWPSLSETIRRHEGKEVNVVVERDGQPGTILLTLPVPGRLGVQPLNEKVELSLPAAFGKALTQPFSVMARTAEAIVRSITGNVTQELAGPVMMVKETSRDTFRTGELLLIYGAVMSYLSIPLSLVVAMVISLRPTRTKEESPPPSTRPA